MNISSLLDAAKVKLGTNSDREIGRRLDASHNVVTFWRSGRSIPSDENLVKLCDIAGEPPERWLLELNISRSTGSAKHIYSRLLQDVVKLQTSHTREVA